MRALQAVMNGPVRKEFVLTRVVTAPRNLVYKAWTEVDHLKNWWGPIGFNWVSGDIDLRPGGIFHYCKRSPHGINIWGKLMYLDIERPTQLSFIFSYSDEAGNIVRHPMASDWPMEVLNKVTFFEYLGKTTITIKGFPVNATETEKQEFAASYESLRQGFEGTLGQLIEYLEVR